MSRTVAEIDAEMAAKKTAGVHHASAEMRALRDERAIAAVAADTMTDFEDLPHVDPSDPLKSEEWDFLQKAIIGTDIEFKPGLMSGMAKRLYQLLDAKLRLWRSARSIIQQVGIGNEWPQWTALGRSDDTGSPLPPKQALPAPRLLTTVSLPSVTEGGMPIVNQAPPMDEMEMRKRAILGTVTGQVQSRPEPSRTPQAASV